MSNFTFALTSARVVCTFVGLVVLLMCVLGALGLADFQLVFNVPEFSVPAKAGKAQTMWVVEQGT